MGTGELIMQPVFAPESDRTFLQDFCVPFLAGAQNQDGGWGFQQSGESRVEPTCWSLLALRNAPGRVGTHTFASIYGPRNCQTVRGLLPAREPADVG
jgi:hypothetical protein